MPTSKILPDGSLYSGSWGPDGVSPQGLGVRHFLDQRLYIGEWDQGVMHGKGILLLSSGDMFEGTFSRSNFHGHGLFYNKRDNRARRGIWKHGNVSEYLDIVGNADDANFGTVFRSGGTSSASGAVASAMSAQVPHFKLMELYAMQMVMKDLRNRIFELHGGSGVNHQQQQQLPNATSAATAAAGGGGSGGNTGVAGLNASSLNNTPQSHLPHHHHLHSHNHHHLNPIQLEEQLQQQQQEDLDNTLTSNTAPDSTMNQQAAFLHQQNNLHPVSVAQLQQRNLAQQQLQQLQLQKLQQSSAAAVLGAEASAAALALSAGSSPLDQQLDVLSQQLLVTVSGPSYNITFSSLRFLQFFALFLFPFLSLPHVPLCPLRVDSLDLEREYVVSGAALRADFELPTWEVYYQAVGLVFFVIGASIPHGDSFEQGYETALSWADVIVPAVLCFVFALLQAAYQSYHRTAHALERLDRHHFPSLAALSAQTVDANCHTLVVSWDEEGLGRVMNKKYQYKWIVLALLYGFLLGFSAPLTRLIRGQNAFANAADMTEGSAVLIFLSIWVISGGITYTFWRIIDLERQLEESMGVVTRCAYLKEQSILKPSDTRKSKFHFDAPITMSDTSQGFLGWYITRSFVLYASTLSNHRSRHAFVSVLALATLAMDTAIIADTLRSLAKGSIIFTTAHTFACIGILGWGILLIYYLYVCKNTDSESKKHLYLADVAGMYHLFRDPSSSSLISRCRNMISDHDYSSKVLGLQISDRVFALSCLYHGLAIALMVISLTFWGLQLQGKSTDWLRF